VKVGSLVYLKGNIAGSHGVIINIEAGDGSFDTWVDILWNSGLIETHSIHKLKEAKGKQ
jgi:hypothetical protein